MGKSSELHLYARVNAHLMVSACGRHLLTPVDPPRQEDEDFYTADKCLRCKAVLRGDVRPRETPFVRPEVILNG